MKKILCFGDSNVYGYIPDGSGRYDINSRWSGILKNQLSNEFEIIEAGCNNRTCFSYKPDKNLIGKEIILNYLKLNPEIIILLIGINDLQSEYNISLEDFKQKYNNFISLIKNNFKDSKIIMLSPNELNNNITKTFFNSLFDENSIKKSKKLAKIYEEISKENNCYFIDLNKITTSSQKDGLHLETEGHQTIAKELITLIKTKIKLII